MLLVLSVRVQAQSPDPEPTDQAFVRIIRCPPQLAFAFKVRVCCRADSIRRALADKLEAAWSAAHCTVLTHIVVTGAK
eukprot:15455176-Alexandrium_andersonii.AAC.1